MKKILLTTLLVFWTASTIFAGEWVQNGDAWMYKDENGDFVTDTQKNIDGKLYFFDENGNLLTGLQKIKNRYYYFNDDGTPKTETFVFNGSTYKVNPRGMIIDISENQFEALKDNVFASNTDNASTELTWNLDIANNLLNKYPLSKRMLRKMIEIKVGQENLTTDKVDWAMANAQVSYREQAIKCATEYLKIRNAIGNPANKKNIIEILEYELFEEQEAKYAAERAYLITNSRDIAELRGALPDEFAELKLAYENEMIYEVYGIGESVLQGHNEKYGLCYDDGNDNQLKDYDRVMIEKRKQKGIEYEKKQCSEKWYISKKALIDKMKNYGFNGEDAMYASNSSGISWAAQAFKTAMVIKIKTPDIQKEGFIDELENYEFTEGEAKSAVQRVFDAYPGGYIENITDEEKIQKLVMAGFERAEAEKILSNINSVMNEKVVMQTQPTQNIQSSNMIQHNVVSAETNQKLTEIKDLINNYLAQQTYSEEKLQIKLQNEHNISMEDFQKICRDMGIDWKEMTKKRVKELIANNIKQEFVIINYLNEERFNERVITTVIQEMKEAGEIIN
ncbi:MAG: hypothetical protein J6M39_00405 [Lachnospiraceae bacterium]|nr:hypothetical protein [Lachnospiraceae bacterium]